MRLLDHVNSNSNNKVRGGNSFKPFNLSVRLFKLHSKGGRLLYGVGLQTRRQTHHTEALLF